MQLDVSRGVRAARPRLPALPRAGRGTALSSTSVVTRMAFPAPPEQVWNALMLFESTEERPPLHLRLLLPIPVRTEGTTSQVGDEIRCRYRSGYLVKRITCIEASRHYEYEVIEQNLRVFSGLALAGGCYTLQPLLGDHTDVSVTTRYASILRPAWLWKRIEAMTFRMFHRHLLSATRRKVVVRL